MSMFYFNYEIWYNNTMFQTNKIGKGTLIIALGMAFMLSCFYVSFRSLYARSVPAQMKQDVLLHNAAGRLQKRLGADTHEAAPGVLAEAMKKRNDLLNRKITIHFDTQNPATSRSFDIALSEHPEWVEFNAQKNSFSLSEKAVRTFLQDYQEVMIPRATHAYANSSKESYGVVRYDVVGTPEPGYTLDAIAASKLIVKALKSNDSTAVVPVTYEEPTVFVQTDNGILELKQLSHGISNFAKSPFGRIANIRKALNERLRGVMVEPGKTFSFNDTLKGAVGWSDALIIVNGKDLVYEPGGGICQASTTAFRAAMLAGLPVEEQANHSLFVTYYKQHGVGIDSTIYPGKQDLVFRNDTQHPIIMLSYAKENDAVVELYGIPDGRSVAIDGPYFDASDAELSDRGIDVRSNQIAWTYDVTYPDGRIVEDTVVSTYKAIPKKLHEEFAVRPGKDALLGLSGTGGITGVGQTLSMAKIHP